MLRQTTEAMRREPRHAILSLMDFVDEFRRHPEPVAVAERLEPGDERLDALAASTAERLCDEAHLQPPAWLADVPACRDPGFVSGLESPKAIAIVESPARFRIRKIFVLESFLSRA